MRSLNFLWILYTLNIILLSLVALSKIFQCEVTSFSKIISDALRTTAKPFDNGKTVNLLKRNLQTKLRSFNLQINEEKKSKISGIAERYIKNLTYNINRRFTSDIVEVLDAFSIFELGKFLCDCSSSELTMYCNSEAM